MKRLSLPPIFALPLLAVALLTGCVNQQAEVQRYRDVLDGPVKSPASTLPAEELPLEDALRLANADNDQLQIAGEDYVQALIGKARAAATFLPSIRFAPTMTRQENFVYPSIGGGSGGNATFQQLFPQNYSDVPITTTINTSLVRDIYDVARAAKTVEQQRALLLDLQSTVLQSVAQTYYGVLESEQSVRTLASSVEVQEARVKNVTNRFNQGVARRLDVLQSQADAAATRVQLTDARNNVTRGRATLAYLLGQPRMDLPLVDRFTPPDQVEDPQQLLHIARMKRQDMIAAAQAVNAGAAAVKSAWGQYFPSVGVNLNTFLYRESFPSDSWWSALFSFNLPLFEEGIIHNNVREAYSRLRQAVSRARQTDHQVSEDVQTAYGDYEASRRRVRDLITEVDASRQAYETATHAFTNGTATNLDVLTAQNTQLSSQLRLDTEIYNTKVTYLNLLRVTGRLDRDAIEQIAAQSAGVATRPAPLPEPADTQPATR